MKITQIMTVAIAAVFLAGVHDINAAEDIRKDKGRTRLKQENKALVAKIDSLQAELDRCRSELNYADSLANEMFGIYEDSIDTTGAGIAPELYTAEVSDSLLNIWYTHKMAAEDEVDFDMDSVKFESNVPDSVYIERLKKMNSFISLPYNDIVKNYIILYSEKMPTKMSNILGLCQYYMPIFDEIFNRYDLPEELKAMAVIESAMNPLAVSRAGAKGMWQFMYSTAKMYGLHIDSFVDERMDPVKSAEAAAQYLQDSYEIFGDWNLAIASYNCGAGNVNKAIRRSGGKRAFWDIWPYLPRETRGYVPAFIAATYAYAYHEAHNISYSEPPMPIAVDTIQVTRLLHLGQVASTIDVSEEALKLLNPQYKLDIIPAANKQYTLVLPTNRITAYISNQDSIFAKDSTYLKEYLNPEVVQKKITQTATTYRVKKGDTLGAIARRHGVTVRQLMTWNNLRSADRLSIGQRLQIMKR